MGITGLEPATFGIGNHCSTFELYPLIIGWYEVPRGIEPRSKVPKTLVLPLHHGTNQHIHILRRATNTLTSPVIGMSGNRTQSTGLTGNEIFAVICLKILQGIEP